MTIFTECITIYDNSNVVTFSVSVNNLTHAW